jgi:hypothetical protein
MVRQIEVAKDRRSNMAHSTVNAPAKKGGAGGNYTWGSAMKIADYELFGIDFESIRVTTADIRSSMPITEHACFNVSLDDQDLFPPLSTTTKAEEVCAPESAVPEEVSDWVVVTPEVLPDTLVDAQHPRHLFGKKSQAKRAVGEGGGKERPMTIDWSQAGIPQEVKKQILKACMSPSHEGPYAKKDAPTLPLDVLRAQNVASKQRSSSMSRQKSVPRSASKPRMMKQPNGRH